MIRHMNCTSDFAELIRRYLLIYQVVFDEEDVKVTWD